MTILYVDTSSNYLYTGLVKENELLSEKKLNLNHDLSTFAVDEINKMFASVKLEPNDIDKIIVVSGPGSFTGIRIGMTFAKIFAFCLKKEITTITSLEAMTASSDYQGVNVPVIDARRGFVYAMVSKGDEVLLPSQYIALSKLKAFLDNLDEEYRFISNDQIKDLDCVSYDPNILKIVTKYKKNMAINPHLIEPTYLKLTEAEENLMKEE